MPEHERFRLADYADTIREVLDSGGEFTMFPGGTSMLPLIVQDRDSVTLVKAESYCVGDIAFYKRSGGEFVLHRIIGKQNDTFTMCGDNQISPEYGIMPEQIIARVGYLTRRGKRLNTDRLTYRIYVLLWRSFFLRRVFFKLRRVIHGE